MTTLPVAGASSRSAVRSPRHDIVMHRIQLLSGTVSSLLYATMLAVVPMQWEGYSSASRVPSELSAIGAPTRALWLWLGALYALLYAGGGAGVWRSAEGRRALRVAAGLMLAQVLVGAFWPPMHLRGAEPTLTDTLHVAFPRRGCS